MKKNLFVVPLNTKVLADLCCIVVYSRFFFLARTKLILNNENIVIHMAADAANHIGILDDCDTLQIQCPLEAIVQLPPTKYVQNITQQHNN